MRVMMVEPGPGFSVQDVYSGWYWGLEENGVEVVPFNFGACWSMFERAWFDADWGQFNPWSTEQTIALAGDMLLAHALKTRPDVVILVMGKFTPLSVVRTLRQYGAKVVYLFTESPYEDDIQANHAGFADLSILNDPQNLDLFPPGTYYQPHCYDPRVHYPGGTPKFDFSFVGTGFDSRVAFFEAVDWRELNVRFGGNWEGLPDTSPLRPFIEGRVEECMFNQETADLYRASAMSANFYRRESNQPELSTGWAMGPREVELAACGTFFLRDPRPEGDELFPMLPTFDGPEDFSEKLHWWHAHPSEREEAARQASSAIADRTFEQAARRLLRKLER